MKEYVAGRAHVEDTPELDALLRRSRAGRMGALWTVANSIEPWHPSRPRCPCSGPGARRARRCSRRSSSCRPEQAGRRVVMLVNPGARAGQRGGRPALFRHPGDGRGRRGVGASPRRLGAALHHGGIGRLHDRRWREDRARAARFRADTERHLARSRRRCRRQHLHLAGRSRHPAGQCARCKLLRRASRAAPAAERARRCPFALYGTGFLQPAQHRGAWRKPYSPLLKFPWDPTYEALRNAARVSDGSPFDGILMEYVNPATGGPVMATIGASMQMLRPGEHTKAHRHTGSFIYQVAKGAASPSSPAAASTGRSATSSSCPPGPCTSTRTCPRPTMPACSLQRPARPARARRSIARRNGSTMAGGRRSLPSCCASPSRR